ncbi:hypothetical protein QVD17_32398 [Tagetes erecta]|uniref:Uncharacterized protein n=1 Tax=Tagetes erecta TaxID=13708 RepID=A0AAD8K9K2_TARER|nr:hypothetical protein QVD17_32398 [Tagetes erecta]
MLALLVYQYNSSVFLSGFAGEVECCLLASFGRCLPEVDDVGRFSPLLFGSAVAGVIVLFFAALSTPRVPFGLTVRLSGTPTIECNSGGRILGSLLFFVITNVWQVMLSIFQF